MQEEGDYRENCLCLAVLCAIMMVHNKRYEQFLQVGQLYRALILLSLALFEHLCVFGLYGAMYVLNFFCLHPSLYLLVS